MGNGLTLKKLEREMVVLGGGCFWCIQAVFDKVPGIISTEVGYAGGKKPEPTYEEVCSGRTGHAEAVKVVFNSKKITLKKVLEIFFKSHDPTSVNSQGNDVGEQYRSIILVANDAQKKIAEEVASKVQKKFDRPLVTTIKKLEMFWPGEAYHQKYFEKNPYASYCQLVIAPKINKIGNKR